MFSEGLLSGYRKREVTLTCASLVDTYLPIYTMIYCTSVSPRSPSLLSVWITFHTEPGTAASERALFPPWISLCDLRKKFPYNAVVFGGPLWIQLGDIEST